MTMITSLD